MMRTVTKKATQDRVLKGMKKRKGGRNVMVKVEEEEVLVNDEKNPQCSSRHFPSDPSPDRLRKRIKNHVNKKVKVKNDRQKELHVNNNSHNTALGNETTTIKKKAMLIAEFLDRLYPYPPVPLNHYDTFTLLVAVILSAQTTDGKVVVESITLTPFCILLSNFTHTIPAVVLFTAYGHVCHSLGS